MRISRTQVGEVELSVAEAGSGGVPLLLLHGFTGAKEDFADFIDAFADRGWHVLAPDHRGHGDSDKPTDESAYSLDIFASDVVALADRAGFEHFALLGHSMGGMIAQEVALQLEGRLTSLVLMDTAHGPLRHVDRDMAAAAVHVARTYGMERLRVLQDEQGSPLRTPADDRVRAERPGYVEFGQRKFESASPAMYAAMVAQMLGQVDRLEALRSLAVPTLVVVGDQDEPFLGQSRRMAEAIPGARLAVVPDAGHSPQFEAPDEWWDEVTAFLEQVRQPHLESPR